MFAELASKRQHGSACAQIKVYNLQGKNYIFTVMPTCKQILGEACVAVASKTKKNILITIQVRRCFCSKY